MCIYSKQQDTTKNFEEPNDTSFLVAHRLTNTLCTSLGQTDPLKCFTKSKIRQGYIFVQPKNSMALAYFL